jgi:hypothetical protein
MKRALVESPKIYQCFACNEYVDHLLGSKCNEKYRDKRYQLRLNGVMCEACQGSGEGQYPDQECENGALDKD